MRTHQILNSVDIGNMSEADLRVFLLRQVAMMEYDRLRQKLGGTESCPERREILT